MAVNYEVNYEDERFTQVNEDKQTALDDVNETYKDMIDNSDGFYQAQIDASQQWADNQTKLQKEQHAFDLEQIEQQKAQAEKDYTKEQSGAYVDWQKQSSQHGVNAEKMAQTGMTGTGFSESSQVSMYNTYQNRVASARESYQRAVLNYDNSIKEAKLQNSVILAEIAQKALEAELELSLQGFQYKNQLVLDQMNKKLEVDEIYHQRWQDVLGQINTENALAENVRQFNQEYDLRVKEYNEGIRQFNEEIARLKEKDAQENAMQIQELELRKAQLEEEKRQFDRLHSNATIGGGGDGNGNDGGNPIVGDKVIYEVDTPYYQGKKNPDATKFGTFSNGYQPKGISGHGMLSKSGQTIKIATQTLAGQKETSTQNVWKAEDGTLWYWEGRQNKYIQIPAYKTSSGGGGGGSTSIKRVIK